MIYNRTMKTTSMVSKKQGGSVAELKKEQALISLEDLLIRYPFRKDINIADEVSTHFGVSSRTVYNWIKEIRETWKSELKETDVERHSAEFSKVFYKLEQELWNIITDKTTVTQLKIQSIQCLAKNRKLLNDTLLKNGALMREIKRDSIFDMFDNDDTLTYKQKLGGIKDYFDQKFLDVGLDLNQSTLVYAKDLADD